MEKTILKRATAYVLAFVMAFSLLFTGNNAVTASAAAKVTSIKVAKSKVTLEVGKSANIKVTVKGSNKKFTAKSKKKSIATVKVVGKKVVITAKKAGTTKITVTTKGKKNNKKLSKKITVTVKEASTTEATTTQQATTTEQATTQAPKVEDKYNNVTITSGSGNNSLTPGKTTTLTVPVDAADKSLVTWESSNPNVASVDSNGNVTGGSVAGNAVITARINGKEIGKVTISVAPVNVTGVQIKDSENGIKLTEGGTTKLSAIVLPVDATNKKVSWTSSDQTVATVTEGTVKAVKEGKTTIKVTTDEGSFSDEVEVTVTAEKVEPSGLVLSVPSPKLGTPYTDESKGIYSILTGSDVTVRAVLTDENHKGLGNQSVKLTMKPQFSWGLGESEDTQGNVVDDYLYKIDGEKSTQTLRTDENGQIEFSISLTEKYLNAKPVDGYVQSFELQANSGNYHATATLRFGSVDIQKAVILNNYTEDDFAEAKELEPLVKGKNAKKSGQRGWERVSDYDGDYAQYVTSQQETYPVTLYAAPYIMLPPSVAEQKSNTYIKYFEEDDYTSGPYGLYYDDTSKTTKTIERLPAGLTNATMIFSKMVLSDFTRIDIDFYRIKEDGSLDMFKDASIHKYPPIDDSALSVQIPDNVINTSDDVYVKISIQSEGQINENQKAGYVLDRIEAMYKSAKVTEPDYNPVANCVRWEKDNLFNRAGTDGTSANYTLSPDQAKNYLPTDDADYLADGNTYSYSVPSFPHVGNAIITAKSQDGAKEWHFTYPIVNGKKNNSENTHDIAPYSESIGKAVLVGTIEVNEIVGTVNQVGNAVVVSSDTTGYTPLMATIDISSLSGMKDQDESSRVFRTYSCVQWAPYTNVVEEEVAKDFYALKGQTVEVTAKLFTKVGSPVTQSGDDIRFMQDGKDVTDKLKEYITTANFVPKSADGQIKFSVRNITGSDLLSRLTAETDDYNVVFYIGGEKASMASIHWVQPGLYFKNAVDKYENNKLVEAGAKKSVFDGSVTVDTMSHKTNTKWTMGLKTIGRLPAEDEANGYTVDSISGINVSYTKSGTPDTFEVDGNNFTILNKNITKDSVTGALTNNSIPDSSKVKFTIMKNDEIVGEYNNVGTGDVSGLDAKMILPIDWTENGLKVSVRTATGSTAINKDTPIKLYVLVTDENDNKINKEGTYTIKAGVGKIAEVTDAELVYAETGVGVIDLAAPESTGELDVTVTVGSITKDIRISYKSTEAQAFSVMSAVADPETSTVTVKFTSNLDNDTKLKALYEVKDTAAEPKTYTIESINEANSADIVVLKLTDGILKNLAEGTQLRLTIGTWKDKDTGMTYELYDQDHRVYRGTVDVTFAE